MAADAAMSFAVLLRRHRAERGLTQEELSERAGLSARGIRALESGERTVPQRETVRLLAEALGLSGAQLRIFEDAARRESRAPAPTQPDPIAGFLGARPMGPLVARDREIQALVRVLDGVAGGQGQLIMLAGEPGIGKTRLAQEVTMIARSRAFLVASGRCYEPRGSGPYFPFLEALATVYSAAPDTIRSQIPDRWPYVERLLPTNTPATASHEIAGQDIQYRLLWGVSEFLQAVADATPLTLVLDDLHWADGSSLELLQYLARQTRGSRVLLLGTYRDADVGLHHPLARTLLGLTREGLLEEIAIRPLALQGTAALAAVLIGEAKVSPEFAMLIHKRTDGNAFFTQEVVRALMERGLLDSRRSDFEGTAALDIDVPRNVRSAIAERVARLSVSAQRVLHEASVLGQTFAFDDLWRMGGRTEAEVEEALEEALAVMVLRSKHGDEYSFNHALTQQSLYADLPPRQRLRLHAAAGGALEKLPERERRGRAALIAWHLMQAGQKERALPHIMLAGDEAEAAFAHAAAEQHYRQVISLARRLSEPRLEAEALEKLGSLTRITARHADALDYLERAAALSARAGFIENEARATRELGFAHYYRGTPEQGVARIRGVIERLGTLPRDLAATRALADLHGALSMVLWPAARYREALSSAERASKLARSVRYERSQALADTFRGMALTMLGPLPEARELLESAAQLCVASGETWWMINALGSLGRAYLDEGETSRAREYLERSHALITSIHDRAETAWIESNLAEVSFLTGAWADARVRYDAAIALARKVGDLRYLSFALLHLAELSALEGRWDEAQQGITDGLRIAQQHGAVPAVRKAQRLLAENELRNGRAHEAVERLLPLLGPREDELPRCFPPPAVAEAYLALENIAAAEELVWHRVQRFRAHGHRRALALWLRLQGVILQHRQDWVHANAAFREAISIALTMPYPFAEMEALGDWGRMLTATGDREGGRARLERAHEIAGRLGARASAQRIRQDLAVMTN